ncbi:MAG TPA: sigma-54 dependent transcriptional regulator [Methylomirabilota bacterium]|jgi:two-component system response regulator AtoC|nr:sigma-54 dependent transcriptional regulator [Methylomirabilota bacterium]
MKNRVVLVAVPEPSAQQHLAGTLSEWGYEPVCTASMESALLEIAQRRFLVSLLDLGNNVTDLLRRLKIQGGSPGAIVVIADADASERAVEATALGADDFLQKPFSADDLENVIKSALARPRRSWERTVDDEARKRLRDEVGLWRSPKMSEVREIIEQAARVDVTVLICGETGAGKDVVARAIHDASVRETGPFIKVNCAAVPRELLESELFGHERGAFTGAHQLKIGKFESADRGTIFLDEIGDLHPALQGKLLHVLQDGQFSRVGGRSTVKVDVRVLAATNQDLEQAVAAGRFREDLYYRLNVIQVMVPPLRERPEEIPVLAEYFMQRYSQVFRREGLRLPPETLQRLMHHRFPGNVRELENMVKRMIVLGDPLLRRSPLFGAPPPVDENGIARPAKAASLSLKDIARKAAQVAEREAILQALEQTQWNRVRAAKLLEISYRALLYKIKDSGLDRERRGAHRP